MTNDWQGTFATKEEALVAAVGRLIFAAQSNHVSSPEVPGLLQTSQLRLSVLRKRLFALELEAAHRGIIGTADIRFEINLLKEEIQKLQAENELVGDIN